MRLTAYLFETARTLSLAQKFLALAALPVGLNAYAMGDWVTRQVANQIIQVEGASTALYVDAFIEPLLQDLTDGSTTSEPSRQRLNELITTSPIGRRITTMKIWTADGTIVYSNRKDLFGARFTLTTTQNRAFAGEVVCELDDLHDEENVQERKLGTPMLEIYAPVRRTGTDSIIAVAEVYVVAEALQKTLRSTKLKTWLIVSALSVAMLGLLFGIVKRGSRTIDEQRTVLQERLLAQERLLEENKQLGASLEGAHRRAAESTERFMRRVGSDLHDGPAQSIGLAALHLGELQDKFDETEDTEAQSVAAKTRQLLSAALDQIRNLASGLAPPELDGLDLPDALRLAVRNHEWATGTHVDHALFDIPGEVPQLIKICLYRFVQEGLNNAYRHAGGRGQRIKATLEGDEIIVEIADAGPGLHPANAPAKSSGLGLSIMRDRIESLGGTLKIVSGVDTGTRLCARLNLSGA